MKDLQNRTNQSATGLGFLLGGAVAVVTAAVVFFLIKDFVIAITSALPLGITLGIALEQRFRGDSAMQPSQVKYLGLVLLALGILALIVLIMIVNSLR